jgi:hypothetical protein
MSAAASITGEVESAFHGALIGGDFGSYSNPQKLRQMPFAEFKLGRAFVANCGADRSFAQKCCRFMRAAKTVAVAGA